MHNLHELDAGDVDALFLDDRNGDPKNNDAFVQGEWRVEDVEFSAATGDFTIPLPYTADALEDQLPPLLQIDDYWLYSLV